MAKRVSREASDATKFKQSLAKQGTNNPNYGKWKIQCKLPPKTKRFCPLVLK